MEPTRAQLRVLVAVDDHVAARGYPPSLAELAARVGVASRSAVKPHLEALTALGLLTRESRTSRAMALTVRGTVIVDAERTRRVGA